VITNTEVYANDFYAWCLRTADLVRTGQWDAIDPEALAEELESLGKSQKREVESRLEVLVLHLLKWEYQPTLRQTGHSWHDTIREQRSQIARVLRDNPSLRPQVSRMLEDVYPEARERARGAMTPWAPMPEHGARILHDRGLPALPPLCPWTEVEILDKDFWPGP